MGNVVLFMSRRGLSVLCGRQSERIRKFVGIRRERVVAEMRMVTAWVGTGAQNTDELQGKPRGAADGARGGTERNRRFKGSPGVGGRSCPQKKDAAFCNAEMSESGGF